MAGLGKYGDEGFSAYHSNKNPFLIAQSVSASTLPTSPMKDFGIFSIPAAIAAAASASSAAAAGAAKLGALAAKGGAAITKAVGLKGASAKLAATGAKMGTKATAKWAATKTAVKTGAKGVTKSLTTKPTLKGIFSGKKATIGAKTTKEATKTGVEQATKAGTEEAIKTSSKSVAGETDILTRNIKDTSDLSKAPSVAGEGAKDAATTTTKEPSWLDKQLSTENLLSKGQGSLDRADAKGEAEGEKARARSAEHFANAGQNFGGQQSHVPQEDLGSVLTFKRAMPKSIPLRLRTKRALSPFKNKGKMKYDEAKGWGSEKMSAMKGGAGELGSSKSKVEDSLQSMSVFGDK